MKSLIIPCYWYNSVLILKTRLCLETLNMTTKPEQVIVVDDGSPVTMKDLMGAELVERKENGGYAAAVNSGLKQAKGDIIIISNNDIEFLPGWLEEITKPLEQGYDISTIRTTEPDGWDTEDKITQGDKFGSIWAMHRHVYETIGELDESFGKGYFEDLDYQKRAEDAGFKVAKNHNGLVIHEGKATFRVVDPDDKHYKYAMQRFKEKHGSVW